MTNIVDGTPESHRDLLTAPLTATLTTIDGNGRPQSTAVWFLLDGDGRLTSSITSDRQKYTNLTGNPECDLFIIDPQNPFRTLEIRARAELEPDPEQDEVRRFAEAYGVDPAMLVNESEDRYTVTYRPRRIVANPAT